MKIKEGYLVHEVAGNYVVIKIGQEAVNFNGLITLSESAKMLWELLKEEGTEVKDLVNKLLSEYDIDEETATNDTLEFIESLKKNNILE